MAGRGALPAVKVALNPRILVLNRSNEWAVAVDPLHFDKGSAGVGPGLSFAQTMLSEKGDDSIVIGLVPCAVGGSPLKRWEKGGELFLNATARARLALKRGTLKGVLWHQGETDSMKEEDATTYSVRLARMISDFRAELGLGEIPFVVGKLCPAIDSSPTYPFAKVINQALENVAQQVPSTACVDARGLKGDVHFDTESQVELGKRYAKAMSLLLKKSSSVGHSP